MPTLPPKLYFRIGEVASLVGVEPHVLRYWEREFRSIRPTKSAKGQRVYSRRDVENLMRVRDLLYADGFTIAGAKKKLQRSGAEPDAVSSRALASEETSREPALQRLKVNALVPGGVPVPEPAAAADRLEPAAPGSLAPRAIAPRDTAAESRETARTGRTRTALKELRSEIEAFLAELSD